MTRDDSGNDSSPRPVEEGAPASEPKPVPRRPAATARSTWAALVLIFSLALNLAFAGAWAWRAASRPSKLPRREWRGGRLSPLFEKLDLTDVQREELEELSERYRAVTKPLLDEAREQHRQMLDVIFLDRTTLEEILAMQENYGLRRREAGRLAAEHLMKQREVLTAEQRARMRELLKESPPFHSRRGH